MSDDRLRIIIDALNQASSEFARLKADLKDTDNIAAKTSSGGIAGLYDKVDALKGQMLAAGGILVGFGMALKKVYEFGEEGMQIQRLKEASGSLAASMGADMEDIISSVRAASMGTMSDYDIMQSASRAMMLGVSADADQLANLMQIAALRGRVMGLSTTQAFDDIVRGIGRMSPMILDNLGIVIDADTTMTAYAKSIGKTAEQLTSAEKRQALFTAVLKEGNKLLAETGGLQEDNATANEQLQAHWKNFSNQLKEWVAGPASDVVVALDNILFRQQKLAPVFEKHSKEVEDSSQTYEEYITELQRAAEVTGYTINANGDLVQVYNSLYGTTEKVIVANYALTEARYNELRAAEWQRQTTEELISTSVIYDDQLRRTLPNQTSMNDAIEGGGDAADYATRSINSLHREIYGLSTLDVSFGSQIVRELDKIKFYLAGGQPLQAVTEAIREAIDAGAITPEQAQELFGQAYLGAQALQVRMNELTVDQAAENVRKELNVSLEEAKRLVEDTIADWANFPAHIWTTLHIRIQEHNASGQFSGEPPVVLPGDYNPDTGTWDQAAGGQYLVTQPTTFRAGEYVPEIATFTPLTHGESTVTNNTPTVILQVENMNVNNQEDVDNLLAMIASRIARM